MSEKTENISDFVQDYSPEIIATTLSGLGVAIITLFLTPFLSSGEIIIATIILGIQPVTISLIHTVLNKVENLSILVEKNSEKDIELLESGEPWFRGARLIQEMEKGSTLCASTSIHWEESATSYTKANESAVKKGVKIRRLFSNDQYNRDLAQIQRDKGRVTSGRIYTGDEPLMNYCYAKSRNDRINWGIVWSFSSEKSNFIHGLLIRDQDVLSKLQEDFEQKWDRSVALSEID